jgi:putative MATE family efflux protein
VQKADIGPNTRIRRDWTQGNIFRNLILISWPMMVTQLLMSLGPTIDMIWVGRLGPDSVAAVGVAGVVVMLAMGVMMGFTMGMLALISRAIGAKDLPLANRVAQQAVVISAIYSIVVALIGQFLGRRILLLVTADPDIVRLGTAYLRIEFWGAATMVFRMTMDVIMQSSGDTVNPMWIAAVYRGFHILLCPFLVFGWWIFPQLGVVGAAWTGVIAQGTGVLLGLSVLRSTRSRLRLNFSGFRFDIGIILNIVRIGFPASISGIQRSLSQFLLQIFIAPFGGAAIAAHAIAQRVEMFIFMPAMALGMGAGVLVGQNLGARKPERAERSAWTAVGLVEGFIVLVSAAMFLWTGPVVRLFSNDPALDAVAAQFIHIAIAGWLVMGFMFVLMNCLQSAGDTLPPMVIGVAVTWLITILPAYLLPKYTGLGVAGIRWAMSASIMAGAIAFFFYFRTGRWKTRAVTARRPGMALAGGAGR